MIGDTVDRIERCGRDFWPKILTDDEMYDGMVDLPLPLFTDLKEERTLNAFTTTTGIVDEEEG